MIEMFDISGIYTPREWQESLIFSWFLKVASSRLFFTVQMCLLETGQLFLQFFISLNVKVLQQLNSTSTVALQTY